LPSRCRSAAANPREAQERSRWRDAAEHVRGVPVTCAERMREHQRDRTPESGATATGIETESCWSAPRETAFALSGATSLGAVRVGMLERSTSSARYRISSSRLRSMSSTRPPSHRDRSARQRHAPWPRLGETGGARMFFRVRREADGATRGDQPRIVVSSSELERRGFERLVGRPRSPVLRPVRHYSRTRQIL
jgi:hypothetical protein